MAPSAAFILDEYPRPSGHAVEREMRALESRGLKILAVSLHRLRDTGTPPVGGSRPALFLPAVPAAEPARIWRAWQALRHERGYAEALEAWLADFRLAPSLYRAGAFVRALLLAAELPKGYGLLHARSLRLPADVARYAAAMRGLPWSCSAHAEDMWSTPEWDQRAKLEDCRWLVACTAIDARHLQDLSPAPGRVELVYHGIETSDFPEPPARPPRDGSDPASPVTVLAVAGADEKSGLDTLLDALAGLRGLHWRLVHVGGGRLVVPLKAKAWKLRIADRISWLRSLAAPDLLVQYRTADLFALPCRVARNGARDGLPQVLLEAQSQGLACVASAVGGIPELITDGETGVLVPPGDAEALRLALAELIARPDVRDGLGAAGNERVRARFRADGAYERLAARFGLPSSESL